MPTNNKWYLYFMSNDPIQIKKGLVIFLADMVLIFASSGYISNELIFIKSILIDNKYPEKMISQITQIEKRVNGTSSFRRWRVKSTNNQTVRGNEL